MSCQTCDHTMQKVNDGAPRVFWCPRCGTIKTEFCDNVGDAQFNEPRIVQRTATLTEAIRDYLPGYSDPVAQREAQKPIDAALAAVDECCSEHD